MSDDDNRMGGNSDELPPHQSMPEGPPRLTRHNARDGSPPQQESSSSARTNIAEHEEEATRHDKLPTSRSPGTVYIIGERLVEAARKIGQRIKGIDTTSQPPGPRGKQSSSEREPQTTSKKTKGIQ